MQTADFIEKVNEAGPGDDIEAARNATIATLTAIGEHLSSKQARRLAPQLPEELSKAIGSGSEDVDASQRPVDLDQIYGQIALETELPHDTAAAYARAVVQTLKQAITQGEITDVASDLPDDLDALLTA